MSKQPESLSGEAGRLLPAAPGSASPSQHEDDWEHDDGQDHCHFCGGEGWVMGDDLDDPLWYDRDAAYKCPCCHGSGDAKDCTFW
jgi:hypothetical protein